MRIATPDQLRDRQHQLVTIQLQRFHILKKYAFRIQSATDRQEHNLALQLTEEKSSLTEIYLYHASLLLPEASPSLVSTDNVIDFPILDLPIAA